MNAFSRKFSERKRQSDKRYRSCNSMAYKAVVGFIKILVYLFGTALMGGNFGVGIVIRYRYVNMRYPYKKGNSQVQYC